MKKTLLFFFVVLFLLPVVNWGQTPYPMSSGNYSQTFTNIANTTNWPNNFNGTDCAEWKSVAVNATGALGDGVKTTVSTATFNTGTSGGVQRGSANIYMLSTSTANACAIDLLLDFTGTNAGTISFDVATVFNGTGDRDSKLKLFYSTDGTTFTEIIGANLPYTARNNVASSASITTISLPAVFNNSATARLRFYEYSTATGGTPTGSQPKISIDNIVVTSSSPSITVGSISGFGNQLVNTTSSELTYTVSGSNLTSDITITPPANFEISTTSGAGFVANPGTLTLVQSSGTVASTTIYVRFKPTALQSYSGNISHTSAGATARNVAVSGMGTQNYYSASSGDLDNTANWGINSDGTGANPGDFTSAGQIFYIRNNPTPTIGANWTVSGTGSKIVVGDGTNPCNFTIPASYSVTGTVDVSANGTLTIQNTTLPTLGTINSSSTIDFAQSSTVVVPIATYGNLKLSNGTKTFDHGTTTVQGNLTVTDVTGFNGASSTTFTTVNLAGNLTLSGTVTAGDVAGGMTLFCQGSGIQTITGNGNNLQLFRLTINNSNGVVLSTVGGSSNVNAGNASGGGVTMTSGNLTTNSNTVTLYNSSGSSILTEAAGKYIIGNVSVTKAVASGASQTFGGIGFALSAAAEDLGNVTVTRVTGAHVTLNGNTSINRIWSINSTNALTASRNLTFGWISDDDNGKTLTSMQVYQSTDNFATMGNTSAYGSFANAAARSMTVSLSSLAAGSTLAFTISQADQPLVLVAPVASAATNGTSTGFTANWSSSASATTYLLDVSTDNFSTFVAGYNGKDVGNVTTYNVLTATAGTAFYYRVRASNVNGPSLNSNTITFTLVSTPVATAATNIGANNFSANWNSSSGATGYLLDVSTDNFSTFVAGYNNKDVGNVTTYNVTSLTSRTTYYYRIRAYDATGISPNSNVIIAATPNQPPTLTSIERTQLNYFAGNPPTFITNTILVSDPDNTTLDSAVIQITGFYKNGADILGFTNANGITGSWDATNGKLTLQGNALLADYQSALRSVTYQNIVGSVPDLHVRTISFKVNDGISESSQIYREISLGNTPPVLTGVESIPLNYKQGDSPVIISNGITITDDGISNLEYAIVQISSNYKNGEDILSFTNQDGVVGTWDSSQGQLVFRNINSSLSTYEAALRSVTYQNISKSPSTLPRTVSFKVADMYSESNELSRIINITPVYTIALITEPSSGGMISGGGNFVSGTTVTVFATPNTGYSFVNWTEAGVIVSTESSYTFIVNNTNRSLVANFALIPYTIDVQLNMAEGGTATGGGTFYYGNSVTVKAVPNAGYDFANWTENGSVVSDSLNYTFLVSGNRNLVANFTTARVLSVTPEIINANSTAGTATISVSNTGGGTLNWSAVSNVFWITITNGASGINNGNVTISYSPNNSILRVGTVTITADGVSGSPKMIEVRQIGRLTSVEDLNLGIPDNYVVEQNYPNPFNPTTIIRYGLPKDGNVRVSVYNILGEEVERLFDGVQSAGFHEVNFNATNLSSGIYIYRISAGSFTQIKKMLLMK